MMPKTERLADLVYFYAVVWIFMTATQLGLTWHIYGSPWPRDATDGPSDRSGLSLKIDYGTGCEYLYVSGALIQRMTKDGKQSGCR